MFIMNITIFKKRFSLPVICLQLSDLSYLDGLKTESLGESMIKCFKILTGLIESKKIK